MCSVCVSFSDFEGGSDSVYIGLCSGGLRTMVGVAMDLVMAVLVGMGRSGYGGGCG